jgi:hypothetical protein
MAGAGIAVLEAGFGVAGARNPLGSKTSSVPSRRSVSTSSLPGRRRLIESFIGG